MRRSPGRGGGPADDLAAGAVVGAEMALQRFHDRLEEREVELDQTSAGIRGDPALDGGDVNLDQVLVPAYRCPHPDDVASQYGIRTPGWRRS